MQKPRHIVIVAGEESGDAHAARLINELKQTHHDLTISGIGGKHMQQAGAKLVADLAQYGVTGITEVFRHFKIIKNAFKAIKNHLSQNPPDLLILVDYPGFNLRLAKYAKQVLGIKIIYYISPQIWAWKANRIHTIKKYIDHMAVILPFEKKIYQKANMPVQFVGHPLVETIPLSYNSSELRMQLNLPKAPTRLVALLPGSRSHEIERHMPVLVGTMQQLLRVHPDTHFVIPVAGTIGMTKVTSYIDNKNISVSLIEGNAIECMAAADFVIVASGTASLECALLKKPMCIIYKSTFITSYLAMKLIKVKYLGLCNLLSDSMLVPEFLQYDCNAMELSRYVTDFFNDPSQPEAKIEQLTKLAHDLSIKKSDCTLHQLITRELPEKNTFF